MNDSVNTSKLFNYDENGDCDDDNQENTEDNDDDYDDYFNGFIHPPSPIVSVRSKRSTNTKKRRMYPHYSNKNRRQRNVICSVLEKILANLNIISQLKIGDKLDVTPTGYFVIQKPTWYSTASRFIRGIDRWQTYNRLLDLIGTAEGVVDEGSMNDNRIKESLIGCIHGLSNLNETYKEDVTLRSSLHVLSQRIQLRYGLDESGLI